MDTQDTPAFVAEIQAEAQKCEPSLEWKVQYLPADLYQGRTGPELYLAWYLENVSGDEYGAAYKLPVRPHTPAEVAAIVASMTAKVRQKGILPDHQYTPPPATHGVSVEPAGAIHTATCYVPVYQPGTKWLLFRFDPKRDIIEVQRERQKYYVDLRAIKAAVSNHDPTEEDRLNK